MLEMYDDALDDAEVGEMLYREKDEGGDVRSISWMLAIQGYSLLMMGKETEALELLTRSVTMMKERGCAPDGEGNDTEYTLTVGWLGGVHCALGNHQEAIRYGEEAIQIGRFNLEGLDSEQDIKIHEVNMARLLVYQAASLLGAGRTTEATVAIQDSLALMDGKTMEGSTRKTALLLHIRCLEASGRSLEAGNQLTKARQIKYSGFLHRLVHTPVPA